MKLNAKASKIIDEINFVNVHDIKGYCEGKRYDGQSNEKLIDEKDDVAFDDRMVSIFRGNRE
jgi:hypothetical protein